MEAAVKEVKPSPKGKKDELSKLVDQLSAIGVNQSLAKVTVCLHHHPNSTSNQLQESCSLRQPEISLMVNTLESIGAIAKEKRKSKGRGRPTYSYRLAILLAEVVEIILAPELNKINQRISRIQEIQSLARTISG